MAMDLLQRLTTRMGFGKQAPISQWKQPAALDHGLLGETWLALDSHGHGAVLFENKGEIWTMPVGPRTSPAIVRLPLGEGTQPRLALNSEGRGIILWQAEGTGERQILGKILGDESAHAIFRTEGLVHHLQAAVDRRGNALVIWLHEKSGCFEVLAHSFDTRDAAWEKEPTSLGIPSGSAAVPRFAVNHRAHAMVLWGVQDELFDGLVASHYWPSGRSWSDRPMPVVCSPTRSHQVGMDDMGNALALWINAPHGQRCSLEASFYDAQSSEWGQPEILGSSEGIFSIRLVMSGDGQALAAWCQGRDQATSRLFAKAFVKGKWQAQVESIDPGLGTVHDFALDIDAEGNAGVLLVHRDHEMDRVSARLKRPEWLDPTTLGTASRRSVSQPSIRLCPQGASAIWVQGDGSKQSLILTETR